MQQAARPATPPGNSGGEPGPAERRFAGQGMPGPSAAHMADAIGGTSLCRIHSPSRMPQTPPQETPRTSHATDRPKPAVTSRQESSYPEHNDRESQECG